MAKSSGLGMALSVEDSGAAARIISNDITNATFGTPRNLQDITGLDKSAHERLHLLADFVVSFTGPFNPAAAPSSHAVFSVLTTGRATILTMSAKTLTGTVLYQDYTGNRGADGSLIMTANGSLSSGTAAAWA